MRRPFASYVAMLFFLGGALLASSAALNRRACESVRATSVLLQRSLMGRSAVSGMSKRSKKARLLHGPVHEVCTSPLLR